MSSRVMRNIVIAAVALLVPAAAFGSAARLEGMNTPGDYTKDYTGIYTYLSGVNSVGNLVHIDTGNWNGSFNRQAGVVLPNLWDGKFGTWSLHLREAQPALGQSTDEGSLNPSQAGLGGDPNSTGEAFDLIWGHKMGSANLGLRVSRSFQSFDNGTTTTEGNGNNGRNVLGVGAGLGFTLNPNADVELALHFQNRNFDNGAATEDGGTAYLFAARSMWKQGGSCVVVPVAKVWSFDQSTVPVGGGASTEDKRTGWQFGVAGNWAIGSDDLLVLGGQFAGNHRKLTPPGGPTTDFNETYYPNLFLGLESHVNPWLTLRAGAQNAVFYSFKTEGGGGTTTNKAMDFTFALGAGVKLGNLMVDATLDSAFPQNPFAQVWGGNAAQFEDGNVPFPHVTGTYTW